MLFSSLFILLLSSSVVVTHGSILSSFMGPQTNTGQEVSAIGFRTQPQGQIPLDPTQQTFIPSGTATIDGNGLVFIQGSLPLTLTGTGDVKLELLLYSSNYQGGAAVYQSFPFLVSFQTSYESGELNSVAVPFFFVDRINPPTTSTSYLFTLHVISSYQNSPLQFAIDDKAYFQLGITLYS